MFLARRGGTVKKTLDLERGLDVEVFGGEVDGWGEVGDAGRARGLAPSLEEEKDMTGEAGTAAEDLESWPKMVW